jgi:hypothetical protein
VLKNLETHENIYIYIYTHTHTHIDIQKRALTKKVVVQTFIGHVLIY